MRPLAAIRRARRFDPRFVHAHPLFWPLERAAARALARRDEFPAPSDLDVVFDGAGPVRFVEATPRPRRRRRLPLDAQALYDGRIAIDRCVPTRAGSWHDLMNALVWGTFPLSKLALHERQHRALGERLHPGARTLPSARTREQDALALLDEGGVLLTKDGGIIVFGHAIYESLVFGIAPAIVAGLAVEVEPREAGSLHSADAALAGILADRSRLNSPNELRRLDLDAFSLSPARAP